MDPNRIPVIVGVGEVNDRPDSEDQAMNSAELMLEALRRASGDGGGGWLERCERILVVPQLSFSEIDIPDALAAETGLDPAQIQEAPLPSGDTPVRLLNDAANAIGDGEVSVCAVVGAEAMRTALRTGKPLFPNARKSATELRKRYGLFQPVELYALYENAYRAEQGQTLAEGQAESGRIWSLMSQVAETSEGAWLKQARSPDEIVEPGMNNRPIAFPFNKLMVANASVNQGAGFFVTSLAAARAAGVPEDRLVHIGLGAAAHESEEPMERVDWSIPVAMRVTIEEALARNSLKTSEIDCVELYSCFPCVPKMAMRILGWDESKPVTVHGGLTFGGGPVANYMSHAVAAMVRKLRSGDRVGFLFANGGHCSHNHCIVLRSDPAEGAAFPQDYHVQDKADAQRETIPELTDAVEGAFPVETYTVIYGREGEPESGVVISRTLDGKRLIAAVDPKDERSIAFLTDGASEPVGTMGHNRKVGELLTWTAP